MSKSDNANLLLKYLGTVTPYIIVKATRGYCIATVTMGHNSVDIFQVHEDIYSTDLDSVKAKMEILSKRHGKSVFITGLIYDDETGIETEY